jgi:hypothetical protein
MKTLADIQASSVGSIAGVNTSSAQFTQYVNDAVRQLIEIGGSSAGGYGWLGTVQAVRMVAYDECLVFPSNVDDVLAMRHHHNPIKVTNPWYSFLPEVDHSHYWGEYGNWGNAWNGNYSGRNHRVVEFEGDTCLFQNIQVPTQLIATSSTPADNGATITIYGTDYQGNELFTNTNGVYSRGMIMTLGTASSTIVSTVTAVQKPVTYGSISLYAFAGLTGFGSLLAVYGALDVNPSFQYARVKHSRCFPMVIDALIRFKPWNVSLPSDVLPLDNEDAIKSMVQSIRSREAGDEEMADKQELTALRRLKAAVNKRFPIEQFVVKQGTFGKAGLTKINNRMM